MLICEISIIIIIIIIITILIWQKLGLLGPVQQKIKLPSPYSFINKFILDNCN